MPIQRADGAEQPGLRWGPFTLRIPFVHTRFEGPEFVQGLMVSGATGLALVPLMQSAFGLSFDEAVLLSILHAVLISSGPILFGEPFAPGWITPALPLVLGFVLDDRFPTPTEKFHAMTALSINLAILLIVLGVTGLGKRLVEWIPPPLKGSIIMGAALSAFYRVFVADAPHNLEAMPVSLTIAMVVCLVLAFSEPVRKWKLANPLVARVASLGLLPGFLAAGVVGLAIGELTLVDETGASVIRWGLLDPPMASLQAKVSPFAIGFPPLELLLSPDVLSLAFVAYVILFGDIVTGMEVLRMASPNRPDEKIVFDSTRTHLSTGIRNTLMALFAPFFPTQGSLWTGVHVIVVNRWAEGRKAMDSLHSGIASYYFFGVPFLYFALPLVTLLKPFMPIALALTLVLTGFACAYVAMEIPRHATERGVVLLGGASLAFLSPLVGLAVAGAATILLLGTSSTVVAGKAAAGGKASGDG